jgi:hypothetical protein
MKTSFLLRSGAIVLALALVSGAQWGPEQQASPPDDRSGIKLPNGKSQRREMLKADYEKSKSDAADLAELAQQLKDDLEKDDAYVLNLRTLKKAEEIEKIARRIKERMKRNL